jgi:ubiquinone/menaquinone biosynthesis C-methylase UbiE
MDTEEAIRRKERAKYTKWYFENIYWVEDIPGKKHYKKFHYNDPIHEKRFRFLTNLLVKYFKFNTFLDAGCGMGHVIRNLLKKGYKCKGTEISKDALKYYMSDLVKKKIVSLAGLEKLPFKDNKFDLVFCTDVMEHIPIFDVKDSIKELIRVTKGDLVLTINLDHPYEYHPTILPRRTWENLFLEEGKLKQLKELQNKVEKECKKKYSEYDFFVFQKIK